jgi:hypothetical protein
LNRDFHGGGSGFVGSPDKGTAMKGETLWLDILLSGSSNKERYDGKE